MYTIVFPIAVKEICIYSDAEVSLNLHQKWNTSVDFDHMPPHLWVSDDPKADFL